MVDRLAMETRSETLYGRTDCGQEGKPEDRLPEQRAEQETVEHQEGALQNQDASFTYGCLDPVMVTQMAKYLDTVYVSGWQSSSTASSTDEPSPDLADYPMV